MDNSEIKAVLLSENFEKVHETKKLTEFRRGSTSLYLKARGTKHPLIIHGKNVPIVTSLEAIEGVFREKPASKPYHNSNMRSFDLRQNSGQKPTRFGYDFGFTSRAALSAFLKAL